MMDWPGFENLYNLTVNDLQALTEVLSRDLDYTCTQGVMLSFTLRKLSAELNLKIEELSKKRSIADMLSLKLDAVKRELDSR